MTLAACFPALLVVTSLATGAFGAVQVDRTSARLTFDPAEGAILRSRGPGPRRLPSSGMGMAAMPGMDMTHNGGGSSAG